MIDTQNDRFEVGAVHGDASALLQGRQLRKSFDGVCVLSGIDFTVRRGDAVLLRGDNGSGKTTLLNILTGFLQPDQGELICSWGDSETSFRFPRSWLSRASPFDGFLPERIAQKRVGRSWQGNRLFHSLDLVDNLAVSAPGQAGERPLNTIYRRPMVRQQEALNRERAAEILTSLGMGDRGASSSGRVSLGQAKRVAIARAINAGAEVLFLDEPLSSLDADGVREVVDLLARVIESQLLALVIVEHDLNVRPLLSMITRVWKLQDGLLVEESVERTRRQQGRDEILPGWLRGTSVSEPAPPKVEQLPGSARLVRVLYPGKPRGKPLLELRDVTVFRGRRSVVSGWSFVMYENELLLLEAPNGWGKTTLLEAVAGLLPIEEGSIRLEGRRIDQLTAWHRVRRGMSVLQARSGLFASLRVRELAGLLGAPLSVDQEQLADRKVGSLSGGERQWLALSLVLDQSAMVTLLDEPFASLDTAGRERGVLRLFKKWGSGGAVLLALPSGVDTGVIMASNSGVRAIPA